MDGLELKERFRIEVEYGQIQTACFLNRQPAIPAQPLYVATAGPWNALQSVVFKDILEQYPFFIPSDYDKNAASLVCEMYQSFNARAVYPSYVDGDAPWYDATLEELNAKFQIISRYFTTKIMEKALSEGFHFAHLSTSTDINIENHYRWLKAQNYKIVLFLCGTLEFEVQWAFKGKKFFGGHNQYLLPPNGEAFRACISTYFKYADELHLHWTHTLDVKSTKAAIYNVKKRFLMIKCAKAYRSFKERYPLFWGASKSYFEMT